MCNNGQFLCHEYADKIDTCYDAQFSILHKIKEFTNQNGFKLLLSFLLLTFITSVLVEKVETPEAAFIAGMLRFEVKSFIKFRKFKSAAFLNFSHLFFNIAKNAVRKAKETIEENEISKRFAKEQTNL